ncbi:lipopolysaccharide assembly outer membrane protein LptD (OstA) [Neolewinella xylanilytica]|uniref:Lipopolysaccharide assembly outer membrane protein LptD (OstA) n=1 Tax=Neolewinella xylanilytica TaxID=1514080 RepID=A0A2S6I516_9BACT|nr:lipopolysaccharide assembly outer membrane protein LptD (OstA) [Neolewinella xylanilytica]
MHLRPVAILAVLLLFSLCAGAQVDSSAVEANFSGNTAQYQISPDSLTAPVDYQSRDSMEVDLANQRIHLYGAARVNYESISLQAEHIVLDYGTNLVTAEPYPDTSGVLVGDPQFSDGGQEFTAKNIKYNFKSKKGIVTETVTTQDDVYVRGGKSKFVSGAVQTNDSTRSDVIYTEGAIFTSCSAEHPHFGVRTQKAKVVPNKLAIIGPSNLEIMGVPTPFWLPFGFFPLKSGRSTGLLFPSDYQYSQQWGFGFQGIGWFFPIGEHVNLQVTSDIYLNGTFTLNAASSYRKRYKYSGNFDFSYRRLVEKTSVAENYQDVNNQGFSFGWRHRQDPRAHPTFTFGGSINFQTNQVNQRYLNSYEAASTNVIRSSMNITKSFPALKSTLTAGITHSQNNQTGVINVNFPDARFQTQTIYPLRNLPGSQRAWYKKLSFRYVSELRSEFSGIDTDSTSFFSQQTLDDVRYGFTHRVNTALSLNVLRYFNVSPNASYSETYYGKTLEYFLDESTLETEDIIDENGNPAVDTTSFATIDSRLNPGLAGFRSFNAGVSVSTQLFGTVRLGGRGLFGLKGLRHVMKPSVSIGYVPSYLDARDFISGQPYFIRDNRIDPDRGNPNNFRSPFAGQIFSAPSRSEGNFAASYSISNLFEAKVWNRKDSTDNIVKLFQNIAVSGRYDLAADSLQWSVIRVSGSTSFFKGLTQVNLRASLDPYIAVFDEAQGGAVRLDRTTLREDGVPFQLTNFSGTISTNLTVAKIRQLFQGAEEEYVEDVAEERRQQREEANTLFEETDILSLFEKFSIRHTYNYSLDREVAVVAGQRDTLRFNTVANSIELRGALQLTENWSVNIGQIGYDFTSKRITYPYLSFARDLHCWEMRFSWAPQRNTYQFTIAVKPGTFDFLEVPVNQNRYDGRNLFGT